MSRPVSVGQKCPKAIIAAIAIAVCSTFSAGTASAQVADATVIQAQLVEQGASERINYSGKLRMLSQRIVAASCYVQSGIDADESRETLAAATAEFTLITNALEFGNADMGIIGAEDRRRTLAGINKLRELWERMKSLATKVADGDGSMDDVASIATQSGPLLNIAQKLVVEITGQYANPNAVRQMDAFAVDIAGRQRMLAQRVSKNTCLVSAGVTAQDAQTELALAAQNFGAALEALRNGAQAVGVRPPPTAAIADGLNSVYIKWESIAPIIANASAGTPADAEQLAIIFHSGNQLTGGMNGVVGLYVEASKFGA